MSETKEPYVCDGAVHVAEAPSAEAARIAELEDGVRRLAFSIRDKARASVGNKRRNFGVNSDDMIHFNGESEGFLSSLELLDAIFVPMGISTGRSDAERDADHG